MKIEVFIPCRLGEPLSALFIAENTLYFGSISGYVGKYDLTTKLLEYFPHCMAELIRDIYVENEKVYFCVGDQFIAVHNAASLLKISDIPYEDFKHKDLICGNYFSFIDKSKVTGKITNFLALFPTSEVERLSKVTSARKCE